MSHLPLAGFFALACLLTWGMGLLAMVVPQGAAQPCLLLAGYGPSLAGLGMTYVEGGWVEVRRLLGAAIPRLASIPWYVAVLIGYPAAIWLVSLLFSDESRSAIPGSMLPISFAAGLVLDSGPLGEEFGWRGYALPRLIERHSPLAAALIVGAGWALWHLPLFFLPAAAQSQLSPFLFFLSIVALSVVMTWLYLRTDGDLGLMILLHLAVNFWAAYFPFAAIALVHLLAAVVLIAAGELRRELPS